MEFVARVAALIPPPRHPLVRYHGVLAPDSPWRAMVVPGPRRPHHREQAPRESVIAQAMVAAGAGETATLPRRDGATLRQRVWGVDALACARCGGRMRWIAVIRDRAVIVRILEHIGEDSALPRMHRARDPC